MSQDNKSKCELLHEIGMYDFAIVEMTEYLDTHPMEKQAIDYVNYYIRKKNQAMAQYSYQYEPLTVSSINPSNTQWKWATSKMPWEGGYQ